MPKISALPPMTTPDGDDEAPVVDDSVGSTKKFTLTLLKEWLQSLTSWITNAMVADGFLVQAPILGTTDAATALTVVMPADNTIPQITEGTEIITVTITPKSSTNVLFIEASVMGSSSVAGGWGAALFRDATAGALAAQGSEGTPMGVVAFKASVVAGSTSPTTFRLRAGPSATGTMRLNGHSGARLYGAIPPSTLKVYEVKAS